MIRKVPLGHDTRVVNKVFESRMKSQSIWVQFGFVPARSTNDDEFMSRRVQH